MIDQVTSVNALTYQYFDRINNSGKIYYKLKQLSTTGVDLYTKVIVVSAHAGTNLSDTRLYPNPGSGRSTNIVFGGEERYLMRKLS